MSWRQGVQILLQFAGTSSRGVIGPVHCTIVDSDSDLEIEAYPENSGASLL